MTPKLAPCRDLMIVDAHPDDYGVLLRHTELRVALRCFTKGEAALAQLPYLPRAEWLVNFCLPDMHGIELLKLIRLRRPAASVALVGDRYAADDELAARCAGATAYLCKPAEASWLAGCGQRVARPSVHAGPIRAPT